MPILDVNYLSATNAQYIAWRTIANALANPIKAVGYAPSPFSESGFEDLFWLQDSNSVSYFFDAVLRTEHSNARRLTQHPVQTGSNITDHSFRVPSRLIMEIGMSDAMSCYTPYADVNGFGGFISKSSSSYDQNKSVNTYGTLRKLQDSGLPLIVATRLHTYKTMIIENISAREDIKTSHGLRATITFQEIMLATVNYGKVSIDTNKTDTAPKGLVSPNSWSSGGTAFGNILN